MPDIRRRGVYLLHDRSDASVRGGSHSMLESSALRRFISLAHTARTYLESLNPGSSPFVLLARRRSLRVKTAIQVRDR